MAHILRRQAAIILAGFGLAAALLGVQASTVRAEEASTSGMSPLALITIPNPREASLLQLRGISGSGTALFRIDGRCHSMPVRFVAGDFGGRRITVSQGGLIRLRINSPEIVRALYEGQDLVSEDHKVTTGKGGETADILIEAGLSAKTGFVINPGRSVLADILGAQPMAIPCRSLAW